MNLEEMETIAALTECKRIETEIALLEQARRELSGGDILSLGRKEDKEMQLLNNQIHVLRHRAQDLTAEIGAFEQSLATPTRPDLARL